MPHAVRAPGKKKSCIPWVMGLAMEQASGYFIASFMLPNGVLSSASAFLQVSSKNKNSSQSGGSVFVFIWASSVSPVVVVDDGVFVSGLPPPPPLAT